jgi:transcriptional regulator with XRE-family HTH domain
MMKTVTETVADNVRAYRQLRGIDQAALARRMEGVGIPWRQVTVSEVERKGRNVTVAELLGLALNLETTIEQLLDTRGPERIRGPGVVLLAVREFPVTKPGQKEEVANLGREIRGKDGDKEIFRTEAIYPEDMTALVCTHKARAVAEWDDETGHLKALHYEREDQP